MKKFFSFLTVLVATFSFAHGHHHHEELKLENATYYHSAKGQLHAHVTVGQHDGETILDLDEIGHVEVKKVGNNYVSDNMGVKLITNNDKARVEAAILLFDRADYKKELSPEMSFHSYNGGFPHLHVDFNKDYTEVKLGDDTFKGTLTVSENKDKIFTEEHGYFTIVIYAQYPKKDGTSLSKTAQLFLNIDLYKMKKGHMHNHMHDKMSDKMHDKMHERVLN